MCSNLSEARGLCEFLAMEPFYHSHVWKRLLQGPHDARSLGGLLSMRGLLKVGVAEGLGV